MTEKEIESAVNLLHHKGLVKRSSMDYFQIGELGREVCFYPELLDEYLAPRRAAAPPQITINAENMQNTQIGDNNTLNVSYTTALSASREQVEASELATETKSSWIATLDDMLRHPLMPGIVPLTAAVIGSVAG